MTTEKETGAKVDLGLLEEDDEFEEFPADDAETRDVEDTTVNVWEDNWDDDAKEDDFANQLSAMEGSLNKRLRERDETPPPSKKRCTQATPPTSANKSNGASNGHAATHTELEALGRNGSARRSSRTSATSSTTSSPPASPARRGRRGAGGSSSSNDQPQTPTRSSGRLRQSTILASNIS